MNLIQKLQKKREEWEKGLTLKCVIGSSTTLVILEDPNQKKNKYSLHRYFTIGEEWQVSVDLRQVDLDEIWDHLTWKINWRNVE